MIIILFKSLHYINPSNLLNKINIFALIIDA